MSSDEEPSTEKSSDEPSEKFLDERWLKKLDRTSQALAQHIGLNRKTFGEVFDQKTLIRLSKLFSDGTLREMDFPISTGKEANIFRATTPEDKLVAIKIYRTSNLTFKHISTYIAGDPRFKNYIKNRREILDEWAKKEFKNLSRLSELSIRVPKPIKRLHNIVIMDYIGTKDKPAPMIKDVKLDDPKAVYDELMMFVTKMYKDRIVHADLSPFNILFYRGKPYIIDVGQAVLLDHPQALEFLKRDIKNLVWYFKKYGIKGDEEKIFTEITKIKKETSS
jgi:RIO kinase 1